MKKYFEINDLSDGTLVTSAGEYAVVKKHRKKLLYAYIGYGNDALLCGFTVREIADAVKVLDFPVDEAEDE